MENEKFTQLMMSETTDILTIEQRAFVEMHKQIISCGTMAGRYFIELARKLKAMNDGKLYLAAGFDSFASYVEGAVGIKYRQARNYIKVAETYTDEYLEAHAGAGVTKLTLLAAVTENEREEIEERLDVNTASTAEVSEAVQNALRERDEAHKQLSFMDGKLAEKQKELDESEQARVSLQCAYDEQKKKLLDAKTAEKELKAEIEHIKERLAGKKTNADEKVVAKAKEQVEELERQLKAKNAELAAAKEQKTVLASSGLLTFKVKFDDIQRLGGEISVLLSEMDPDSAVKCRKALSAVMKRWEVDWQ